jgi:hypothetical protein
VLPWTALLNIGFGDGDGGATDDDDEPAQTAAQVHTEASQSLQ